MWALRRTAVPLRNRVYIPVISRACFAELETSSKSAADEAISFPSSGMPCNKFLVTQKFHFTDGYSDKFYVGRRDLSSQVDAESKGEDGDSGDGFSDLDVAGELEENANGTDLASESEVSADNLDVKESPENELELLETQIDASEKKKSDEASMLARALFKAIVQAPGLSIHTALDKWVEEGNDISQSDIRIVSYMLRKRQMYERALQLFAWVERKQQMEFLEADYANRVDLVARSRGPEIAEKYIGDIPERFQGELVYGTLLANFVANNNTKKAEVIFNRMKDLKFPMTAFACNQLLLLYKRGDRKRIPDVLLLMENENVKPTALTYNILIDIKGQSKDISGMESIVDSMKQEGVKSNSQILAALAKYYAAAGFREKAEILIKEMEGDDLKGKRWVRQALLTLYAELGNANEVERIWKACEPSPGFEECVAAIAAWGKLKRIEEAESVFAKMSKMTKKISAKQYVALLNVYAENKMLAKGKDLFRRMAESGCQISPATWDALVKLFADAGEVEKADSILQKAIAELFKQNKKRLSPTSYVLLLEQYAKRGDVHNAEKTFIRMRQAGYVFRLRQYEILIQAYINAKVPAYGIKERIKADNLFPNKFVSGLLDQVDPLKKTAVSDLLD